MKSVGITGAFCHKSDFFVIMRLNGFGPKL